MTHLCHNVGICHIKMICIKFTEIGTIGDNWWTRNNMPSYVYTTFMHFSVAASARTYPTSFRLEQYDWNAEWADGGDLALFLSPPLHLLPLAPLLSGMHREWKNEQWVRKAIWDEKDARWHSQISHLSSCLQMSNPRCEASCVCIPQGTCLKLCACNPKQNIIFIHLSWLIYEQPMQHMPVLTALPPWYVV